MERCTACRRPFVVATELLEIVDEGLYRVTLRCANCTVERAAVLEDAELEALEHCERAAREQIARALEVLAAASSIDDIERTS